MDRLAFGFQLKELSEQGEFTGLAAVYNHVDLGGDSIVHGAFRKTLESSKSYPLLLQHDPAAVIGTAEVEDSPRGLAVRGKLVLSVARARETYDLLKARALKAISIGYQSIRDEVSRDGVRLLKEIKLFEISLVAIGMNEQALVTSVKATPEVDLKELRQLFQRYQIPRLADFHKGKQQ